MTSNSPSLQPHDYTGANGDPSDSFEVLREPYFSGVLSCSNSSTRAGIICVAHSTGLWAFSIIPPSVYRKGVYLSLIFLEERLNIDVIVTPTWSIQLYYGLRCTLSTAGRTQKSVISFVAHAYGILLS